MFQGFTEETGEFLWGITLHNERGWFLEHREAFERTLKEPFAALAEDTMELLHSRYPESELRLHVSRIYRDARRLFGRGPYKDHLWFSIKKDQRLLCGPMFWFEIGAASYGCGMGFYDATPRQMELFRKSVRENPGPLERLAQALEAQDRFRLEGEFYARPKGDVGPLLNPWYNRRRISLTFEDNFGGDLFSPKLPEILADGYDFLMPFYEYLCVFDVPELRDRYSR